MKRVILIMAAVALMVSTGCKKDEKPDVISLKETEKTLYFGEKYQIEATSKADIIYKVANEYHAEVSETGLVKARFVGETNILLSNGEDEKTFRVIVKPESNLYPEPDLRAGMSKNEVKQKFGVPDNETEDGLAYANYSSKVPMLACIFKNNKLTGYGLMVSTVYSSELGTFLAERYVTVDLKKLIFANGLTQETTTMGIQAQLYNTSYWMVLYAYVSGNSKSSFSFENQFDDLFKQLQ